MLSRLAALMMLAGPACAAAEVTDFTLDNGLRVVVIEDHRAPVVVHMVWYRVGAADEPRGQVGHRPLPRAPDVQGHRRVSAPGEFSDIVAANGGSDNAFTSYDYTAYFQRVAADRLPLMMEMEADRMRDLAIRADTVAHRARRGAGGGATSAPTATPARSSASSAAPRSTSPTPTASR